MIIQSRFYFVLFFMRFVNSENYNLTVQYYENVIKHGQAEAFSNPLPHNSYKYRPTKKVINEYGVYDYIIVGAGSAGAVIATRLSENSNLTILLIEAGGAENSFSDIPGVFLYLQGMKFNWNYKTVPQSTCCLGMINKACSLPRGRALGGSSVINALMYARGNKHDYDSWEKEGNPGWSYKDVLPYFIRFENSQIDGDPGYHGKGGLLNVEYHRPYSPELHAFVDANIELGRNVVDYNGKEQLGVARTQLNTLNGKRHSTAKAFLLRAQNRPNLKVLTDSLVIKVLIDRKKKKAQGVLFSHKLQMFAARASKEVILSAGAFSSPQLLMLSGIGPAEHLRQLKIPLIKNLSVGENYRDHATYYGLSFSTNSTEHHKNLADNVKDFLHDSGPLTISANGQGVGFFQTNLTKTPKVPDIEIIISPPDGTPSSIKPEAFRYTVETWLALAPQPLQRNFKFLLVLLHPKSRGTVRLRTPDPYNYPLIDANFLSDPNAEDIETLYAGIQLVLEMIDTEAFKKLNSSLQHSSHPACKKYKYLSKAFWYCQLRHFTSHLYHPIGTCRMGPNPSKGAVVDHNLRVHGIKRLRVADASVVPITMSGHINAPAMMIGEKLSDILREEKVNRCKKS